jgi:transcriptional regulator of acetoin/glycerol metabolism
MVHMDGTMIQPRHLPPELQERKSQSVPMYPNASPVNTATLVQRYYRAPTLATSQEKELLENALKECGGNKTVAAEKLGMSRTTLWKRLKQHNIS